MNSDGYIWKEKNIGIIIGIMELRIEAFIDT